MSILGHTFSARIALGCLLVAGLAFAGCSSPNTGKPDAADVTPVAKGSGDGGEQDPGQGEKPPAVPAEPDLDTLWNAQVEATRKLLAADKLDEAEKSLGAFAKIHKAPAQPLVAQKKQLEQLKSELADRRRQLVVKEREAKLAEAEQQMDAGKYEAASQAANRVLAISPTAEQEEKAKALLVKIEKLWARQRELRGRVQLLGSESEVDVRSAQSQLAAEPDVALALLIEAVQQAEKPVLVRNALEMMRRMKRPDIALPAMVGVLARVEQKENWADAVRELVKIKEPGAGRPLLELALNSQIPEQRTAALKCLAEAIDPPHSSEIALLPLVLEDNPALPLTLQAMHHGVRTHGQFDARARRGLEGELTSEQEEQLAKLPARLKALGEGTDKETAQAAKTLAIALRQIEPQVLTGVKVYGFSAEAVDGPAAAVLDGKWSAVELPTMWRHPVTERSSIVLDLGEERTVVGVRIWNFNEVAAAGIMRGWKEAEVFVSDSPRALQPNASGIVPLAPGVADAPDYSTTIPVACIRGRYVKLQAKTLWKPDTYTGLAEVQVLGF